MNVKGGVFSIWSHSQKMNQVKNLRDTDLFIFLRMGTNKTWQIMFFVSANWCPQVFLIRWKKLQSCPILHTKYSKYPDSFVLHPIFSRKKTLASSVSFHKYHLYWCRAPLSHAACAFLPHKDVFWLNIVWWQFRTQIAKMQKTFETCIHPLMHHFHLYLICWKIEFETFFKNQVGVKPHPFTHPSHINDPSRRIFSYIYL